MTTFDAFWPAEVALNVVSEDPASLPAQYTNASGREITFWDLRTHDMARAFLERHEAHPWAKGLAPLPANVNSTRWRGKTGYSFTHDAYKFCKKVFAIDQVQTTDKYQKLYWVDGDTVTFAPIPLELLLRVLPDRAALSCLERPGYHSECGFVGYNLTHPSTKPFIGKFCELYVTDAVFELPEWHDSWIFDWLRSKLRTPTYSIPHKSKTHPFINSELGRYMDHCKGNRKLKGRSSPSEQLINKDVGYWR